MHLEILQSCNISFSSASLMQSALFFPHTLPPSSFLYSSGPNKEASSLSPSWPNPVMKAEKCEAGLELG